MDASENIAPYLSVAIYAIALLDDGTSKSAVFLMKDKLNATTLNHLDRYQRCSELELNNLYRVKNIQLDGVG